MAEQSLGQYEEVERVGGDWSVDEQQMARPLQWQQLVQYHACMQNLMVQMKEPLQDRKNLWAVEDQEALAERLAAVLASPLPPSPLPSPLPPAPPPALTEFETMAFG